MNRFSSYLCIFHPGVVGDGLLAFKAVHVLKKKLVFLIIWIRRRLFGLGISKLVKCLRACQELHH